MEKEELLHLIQTRSAPGTPFLVGIDGRCGAGKTTLAAWLQKQLGCPVIHMDDFYLQRFQRTEQRLQEPGGNVDYERFEKEVLEPLKQGIPFSYRPLACPELVFQEEISVPVSDVVVIEGSYALHPFFQNPYDLTVFVDAADPVRKERILRRSSPEKLAQFEELWIPREEAYFARFEIERQADCLLRT